MKDSNTTLKKIKDHFNHYCDVREWKDDRPDGLLLSLQVELGELSEHFKYNSHKNFDGIGVDKDKVAAEIVDVFNYLIRLTAKFDIDLAQAYEKKIRKLKAKYPIDTVKGKLGGKEHLARKRMYRMKGIN